MLFTSSIRLLVDALRVSINSFLFGGQTFIVYQVVNQGNVTQEVLKLMGKLGDKFILF